MFRVIYIVLELSHLFDQKYSKNSKIVKSYYNYIFLYFNVFTVT